LAAEHFEICKIKNVRPAPAPEEARDNKVYFEVETGPTEATRRLWLCEPVLVFGALPLRFDAPLGVQLFVIAHSVISLGSWVAILVSVIITAFFIPNMLSKGTIDLILVKPIRRWSILCFKYLGGLTFIFLNTAFAILGIWLALGLRSGIWANSFLLMIFVLTFFFAILYAVSTLAGVVTRSAVVAIVVTLAAWFAFFLVGKVYLLFDARAKYEEKHKVPASERWNESLVSTASFLHTITPRTSDLDVLGDRILLNDFLAGDIRQAVGQGKSSVSWGESLTVSGIFVALMLVLSCWWFATKDY
jgi:ABC-type transport system involved in multi-copper enzyme maturation permease subunit